MTTLMTLDVIIRGNATSFTSAVGQANAAASSLNKGVSSAASSVGGFNQNLAKIGQGATAMGNSLTKNVTLPVVALGAAAVKSSIDFESAITGVRKTIEGDTAAIEAGIRKMATQIPKTAVELAGIAEAAGQLGIAKQDVLDFTKTVAMMADATDLTEDAAATAFGQLANLLKLNADEFSRLGSTIVDLGNKGASTESQIVDFMLRIAGAGNSVGMTAAQVAGLSAALADAGLNAEAGGTAISKLISEIDRAVALGGDSLNSFADVSRMSAEKFAAAWAKDPGVALTTFIDGLRKGAKEGENLNLTLDELGITEARMVDTMKRLATSQKSVGDSLVIANGAWKENAALAAEAERRYATNESKLKVLKNQIVDVLIDIGPPLVEALKSVVEVVANVVKAFGNLPRGVQEAIVKFMLLAATIGPLLKVFGGFVSMWKTLSTIRLAAGLGGAAQTISGIGAAAGTATPLLGGLLGMLRGLGAVGIITVGLKIATEMAGDIKEILASNQGEPLGERIKEAILGTDDFNLGDLVSKVPGLGFLEGKGPSIAGAGTDRELQLVGWLKEMQKEGQITTGVFNELSTAIRNGFGGENNGLTAQGAQGIAMHMQTIAEAAKTGLVDLDQMFQVASSGISELQFKTDLLHGAFSTLPEVVGPLGENIMSAFTIAKDAVLQFERTSDGSLQAVINKAGELNNIDLSNTEAAIDAVSQILGTSKRSAAELVERMQALEKDWKMRLTVETYFTVGGSPEAQQAYEHAAQAGGGFYGGVEGIFPGSGGPGSDPFAGTGHAAGGMMFAGDVAWIGERGPELWKSPGMGRIIPNHLAKGYLASGVAAAGVSGHPESTYLPNLQRYLDSLEPRLQRRMDRIESQIMGRRDDLDKMEGRLRQWEQSAGARLASQAEGTGGNVTIIHQHIRGSVIAERELMDLVETEGARNRRRGGTAAWS